MAKFSDSSHDPDRYTIRLRNQPEIRGIIRVMPHETTLRQETILRFLSTCPQLRAVISEINAACGASSRPVLKSLLRKGLVRNGEHIKNPSGRRAISWYITEDGIRHLIRLERLNLSRGSDVVEIRPATDAGDSGRESHVATG